MRWRLPDHGRRVRISAALMPPPEGVIKPRTGYFRSELDSSGCVSKRLAPVRDNYREEIPCSADRDWPDPLTWHRVFPSQAAITSVEDPVAGSQRALGSCRR